MIPNPSFSELGNFLRKTGHPDPAELAPLQGFLGIQRHPGFQEHLTRSRGQWKWEPRLTSIDCSDLFRFDRQRVSDNGCTRNGQSRPLASQHAES
jgi:hypothetical protein